MLGGTFTGYGGFVVHPLIKEKTIQWRDYQIELAQAALSVNSLITLPTGLGKTVVATLIIAEELRSNEAGWILFLAPTKPLCLQHSETLRRTLNLKDDEIELWTGEIPSAQRHTSFRILVCTPQLMFNELASQRLSLKDLNLLVLDEAHRGIGEYAYVPIVQIYAQQRHDYHVVGFTASPGSPERLEEMANSLRLEKLLIKSDEDMSVRKYIQKVTPHLLPVRPSPFMADARALLVSQLEEELSKPGMRELISTNRPSFRRITEVMAQMSKRAASERDYRLLQIVKSLASARRILMALERLDLGGASLFLDFMESQLRRSERGGAPKSLKQTMRSQRITQAIELAKMQVSLDPPNPKLEMLEQILNKEVSSRGRKVIVFVSYRLSADEIVSYLSRRGHIRTTLLLGQRASSGFGGMTQKQQQAAIDKFKRGGCDVLIATQVGEEGLDIFGADAIVFYDNTPSAIRFVQRIGRTARFFPGDAYILYFSGTSDERYLWIAKRRESSMKKLIKAIAADRRPQAEKKKPRGDLSGFLAEETEPQKIRILVDERERQSSVTQELTKMGALLEFKTLQVGDYIVSEDIIIERKTTKDFSVSIIDGRLFSQASQMRELYTLPVVLIEGENLFAVAGIHPNALRGAIISLVVDFQIPVIQAGSAAETASYIYRIAEREQLEKKKFPRIRGENKPPTLRQMKIFVVSGLPFVERTTAEKLLEKFTAPIKTFNASIAELMDVEGIGKVKASKIKEVLETETQKQEEKESDS